MDKLEKVIQAFENCTAPEMNDDETCVDCIRAGECPWDDCQERDRKLIDIPLSLAMAALELLKAQEPRVMTLEEAEQNAYSYYHTPDSVKPVFVQFRDETYSDEALTPPWRGGVNQRALLKETNRYGRDFVFWTDRPSAERMKGVEWDG